MDDEGSVKTPSAAELESLRLDAEIKKLRAETDEIQARQAFEKTWKGQIKAWAGIIVTVLTIGASGFGLYQGASTYLDQRAKELDFTVSREIVLLSGMLADSNPVVRGNAALLLSGFEEHAVPILVSNLRRTNLPGLPDHLIHALELILAKKRIKVEPGLVFMPLARQTELVFVEETKVATPDVAALNNYLRAIDRLGPSSESKSLLKALETCKTALGASHSTVDAEVGNQLVAKITTIAQRIKAPSERR